MSMIAFCDKCNDQIKFIDEALLIRCKAVAAWSFANLNRNANQMVESGETVILCKKCREAFYKFIKA